MVACMVTAFHHGDVWWALRKGASLLAGSSTLNRLEWCGVCEKAVKSVAVISGSGIDFVQALTAPNVARKRLLPPRGLIQVTCPRDHSAERSTC
jgi:hypothetical protein